MNKTEEAVRQEFNEWAESGHGERMEDGHGDVTEQILDRIPFQASDIALDAGCGTGWAARHIRKRGAGRVFGTDISDAMLQRAATPGITFVRASTERLPFRSDFFTRILSVESIYYCSDIDKALSEICRVCKPGATFQCMVDLYRDNPGCRFWPVALPIPVHFLWAREYEEKCLQAGFSEVRSLRLFDRRPTKEEDAFEPSQWFPDYQTYSIYRDAGSLLIEAIA